MNPLRQMVAITAMNIQSLPQHWGRSLVVIIGTAGVVAVLVSVLALSTGMGRSLQSAGRADRAIVLREGALSETSSLLGNAEANNIMNAPGVKRNAAGDAIASAEVASIVNLLNRDGEEVAVPIRGVGANAFELRPEVKLIEGRMFAPSVYELIVGRDARAQYPGLAVGSEVQLRGARWRVVGAFESGDTHDSELFTSREVLQSALRRQGRIQSVTVQLDSERALNDFTAALSADKTLAVDVRRESDYFAEQSRNVTQLLFLVAYVIGGIMAVGAVFAALNTMYSAVSHRSKEIGTLRALGFGSPPIVISVISEALVLAFLGGVIGAVLAWLMFNGRTVSSSAGTVGGESRMFDLYVSTDLMVLGILWAVIIGLVGGLFPAVRAARLPVIAALRDM